MFNNRGTKLHGGKNANWNDLKAKSHKSDFKFFRKPEPTPLKTVAKTLALVGAVGVGAAVAAKVRTKKKTHALKAKTAKTAGAGRRTKKSARAA